MVTNQTTKNVGWSLNRKKKTSRETFKETAINITTQGEKPLGAVVGLRSYLTEYVHEKVEGCMDEKDNQIWIYNNATPSKLCRLHFWPKASMDIFRG